ncbi:hypothetical protein [Maritimibacter sp. DP1N21-5]|uniref:hypothetical protein n=1 Tax=Maritimibacter sp. DP1N21-5 TaxID=2836867 RepID=UPI001C459022|nr:hypothetical protein [Maritimibacter sp. DP1N21-5]MBV7408749.1 hypothetical protein [Maritimibacter sp. DP1N21-5]
MGDNRTIDVDLRELATILAALRYMQRDMVEEGDQWEPGDISTNGGILTPLTVEDIDALCERIN